MGATINHVKVAKEYFPTESRVLMNTLYVWEYRRPVGNNIKVVKAGVSKGKDMVKMIQYRRHDNFRGYEFAYAPMPKN